MVNEFFARNKSLFVLFCPAKPQSAGRFVTFGSFVRSNSVSPEKPSSRITSSTQTPIRRTTLPHPLFHAKRPFPGQILSHLFSWDSLERLSLFRGQREKRINLVLRQPQHSADLAIRGTELIAEFPGEIKSLRFGQVLDGGDAVVRPQRRTHTRE